MKKPFIIFGLALGSLLSFAQQNKTDSLRKLISLDKADTSKVFHLNFLAKEYLSVRGFDSILAILDRAMQLGNSISDENKTNTLIYKTARRGIASSYQIMGVAYYYQGKYAEALEFYANSLKINTEIGHKSGAAKSYLNTGAIYYFQGKFNEAVENYIAALKLYSEIGEKKGTADAHGNLAAIYMAQYKYDKALQNYNAGLKLYLELDDKIGISNSYMNLGSIYALQHKYQEALESQQMALKLKKELGIKQGIAESYANLAHVYWQLKDHDAALENYTASLNIYLEMSDKLGCSYIYTYLGGVYHDKKMYPQGIQSVTKGLALAKELGIKEMIKESYRSLSNLSAKMGNYKEAYEYNNRYINIKDTIFNEESTKKIAEMDARYQGEKKEQEIKFIKAEQEKERVLAKQQSRIQLIIIGAVGMVLILVIVFAAFVFKSLKTTRHQKIIIEVKQQEIIDSIHYAKKIQTALMTPENYIDKSLNKLQTKV